MKNLINIPYRKLLLILILGSVTLSCSDDDDAGIATPEPPGMASLVLPADNTQCEVGDVVANMAEVFFEWNEAGNAESYDLVITNLATQEIKQRPNLNTTEIMVRLERGNAYSWMVIAKNAGEETTASDSYRFYVAGEPGSNNVPFPATLMSPESGATIPSVDGKITLEWDAAATDTDGDALTYTLFADTVDGNEEPPEEWMGLTETSLEIEV